MNIEDTEEIQPRTEERPAVEARAGRGFWMSLAAVLVAGAALLGYSILSGIGWRASAAVQLKKDADTLAVPTVSVVRPSMRGAGEELTLPGTMQAFMDTPIWARSSGYLRHWYFDIGAHVTAGQLLADIEAPEIDRQLQQARADLETATANYNFARSTAERYQALLKTDSVAQQDVDQKVSAAAAQKATVDSMTQNVQRLQQIQSFQKVTAPFDGVITARNVDVGALIDAGANTPGKELFHEAQTGVLRTWVSVPEDNSRAAQPGLTADVTLGEFPDRVFHGTLVRTSNAIDTASRTLLVEVDVPNPAGELLPGAYVTVHLKLPGVARALTVPVNALLFRAEGTQVAVVRGDRTQLVPIRVGRDFGNQLEVVAGLTPSDRVIVNPSDSISSGIPVHIAGGTEK
jgi:RND family efflux transporter MFP subunit